MALPKKTEFDEQVSIFQWAEIKQIEIPELRLLNSSLNGVRLSIGAAKKAKRAGMKAGFPDLFLPVARGGFHGLFIELKRVGGRKPDPEQEKWLKWLSKEGYDCYCCKGAESAIQTIISYLNGRI